MQMGRKLIFVLNCLLLLRCIVKCDVAGQERIYTSLTFGATSMMLFREAFEEPLVYRACKVKDFQCKKFVVADQIQ